MRMRFAALSNTSQGARALQKEQINHKSSNQLASHSSQQQPSCKDEGHEKYGGGLLLDM